MQRPGRAVARHEPGRGGSAIIGLLSALLALVGMPPTAGSSGSSETAGAELGATIIVAGDIAGCAWSADRATARLVAAIPGTVMTAGDNAYDLGRYREFTDCYDPTWGRFRSRTRPTPGNHDWATSGAAGYFRYFGWRAGPERRGYYAFTAGAWRVYALVSDCGEVGGCYKGSPQYHWLRQDLAEHPSRCVMAVWHRPVWSSGPHGDGEAPAPLLRLLYDRGAEIVVNGHDHIYERFARARPDGSVDPDFGIRQFIVGTGGAPLYGIRSIPPHSRVRYDRSHGVLRLALEADGYAWRFLPTGGSSFSDRGRSTCHDAPPA